MTEQHPLTLPPEATIDEALRRADVRISPADLPARIRQWRKDRANWLMAKARRKDSRQSTKETA